MSIQDHNRAVLASEYWMYPPGDDIDPDTPEEMDTVDLKWALWSQDADYWEDRAPGMWKRMKEAFNGENFPAKFCTAPKKEIRYGNVIIGNGVATGTFRALWDEPRDLANHLGVDVEYYWAYEFFLETLPMLEGGDVGVEKEFSVEAETFEELMELIDDVESDLIEESSNEWKLVEEMYKNENTSV